MKTINATLINGCYDADISVITSESGNILIEFYDSCDSIIATIPLSTISAARLSSAINREVEFCLTEIKKHNGGICG